VTGDKKESKPADSSDRLESFGIYQLARQLLMILNDSEILSKDFRGRELVKQQIRSLDSVCANMEKALAVALAKNCRNT